MTRSSPRLWASAAALVLAACGEDLTPPPSSDLGPATRPDGGGTSAENILQTLRSGDWGVLAREAERAGLAELLAGPDILTFFAPSDLAFANPSAAVPSDPGLLANLLLHHLVSGEVDEAALRGSGELTSRAGTRLGIEPGPPLRVGGTSLSVPRDLRAGNGLIHGVDAVMRPPRIDEVMASEAELSVLRAALVRASPEVQAVLSGPGPVTLWAPVDSAFGDLDPTQLDPREIDALLRAHVVGGQALSAEMRDGQILTSAQGTELVVLREDARPLSLVDVSGSTVATLAPEQRLANGILHRVDGVLNAGQEGPDDLLDVIPQTGLTALGTAVSEAGVAPAFRSSGPLTVFAPTDAAFFAARALPPEPELLANVLLHHVVVGAVSSSQLAEAAPLTTAAGTRLRVEATIPPAVDGVSLATPVDQLASNGVLHVVDGVMLPPPIGAAVRERSDLSTWARAVDAAGADVAAALDGAAPITVFAPVNSSFGGVDLDALFVDVERLTDLLSYHVA
ncbi:MAG: fasciclin domain-containing protein, partial [Myxococcota bacterium]